MRSPLFITKFASRLECETSFKKEKNSAFVEIKWTKIHRHEIYIFIRFYDGQVSPHPTYPRRIQLFAINGHIPKSGHLQY